MEGTMMLLLFSAFLVVVLYKMDCNEKKVKNDDQDIYETGFRDGMKWSEESFNNRKLNGKSKGIVRRIK